MDKRSQDRKPVDRISACISDGIGIFSGSVSNISHSGLVIDEVSNDLDHHEEILSLTVSSNGINYRLRGIPRWVEESNSKKTVGLRVFSVPRNWYQFVDSVELMA